MATKKVLESEAELSEITFDFDGENYTAPHPKRWPIEVVEAQEEGRVTIAVRGLLGEAQYSKFKKGKSRTLDDLDKFVEKLLEAADVDLGKLQD